MKKSITVFCIAAILAVTIPFATAQAQTVSEVLKNETVVKMLKDGLSPEIVVAKIKSSESAFDTSADAMTALKQAGVPDSVILAMVEAGSKTLPAAQTPPTTEWVETKVADGQQFEIELARNASGEDLKVGDIVDFSVTQPVVVNNVTIIEKGAPARATITTAKRAGHWGRAGKLEWAMKDVMTADGNRVPVRFTQRLAGDSKGGTVAVAAVATTVLLGPLGLLWGLKKGKPAIIPAGNRYPVFIHGDVNVKGHPTAKA